MPGRESRRHDRTRTTMRKVREDAAARGREPFSHRRRSRGPAPWRAARIEMKICNPLRGRKDDGKRP